jgi:predicted nucleic acid-binding protein
MITAIDTNVIIALWDRDPVLNAAAESGLDRSLAEGSLLIAAPVFAELMAAPGRTETFLNAFLQETGVRVDWDLGEAVWRSAGKAFQTCAARRRRQHEPGPRRIVADFLIGAHAEHNRCRLLTLDARIYRAAFPNLTFIEV